MTDVKIKKANNPEKYQEMIKELRKLECNKKCAECSERSPQTVVLDYAIFVCMACSGIHREFNHKVKSISMYNFTKEEYENFKNGGNDVNAKTYLAKWKASEFAECSPGDIPRIREYIKLKYIEKKWSKKSKDDAKPEKNSKKSKQNDSGTESETEVSHQNQDSKEFTKSENSKIKASPTTEKRRTQASKSGDNWDNYETTNTSKSQTAVKMQPVPVVAAKNDLFDFDFMTTTLPPKPAAQQQQAQSDNWDFSSNNAPVASNNNHNNDFNPFASASTIPMNNLNNFYSNPAPIPYQNVFTQPILDSNPNPFLASSITNPAPVANPFLEHSSGPLSPNPFLGGTSAAKVDPYSQSFNSMSFPTTSNDNMYVSSTQNDPQASQKAMQEQMALQQMALQQKALQEQIATQQRLLQEQQQKLMQDQLAMQQKALQDQMAMQQKLILEQQQALQQQVMQQQQQQLYQQQSQVPSSKPVAKAQDTADYFSNLNLGQPNELKDSVPDMWKSWEKPTPTPAVSTTAVVAPTLNHTMSNQVAPTTAVASDPYGLLAAQQQQQQQIAAMQSQQMMYNYPQGYYNNGYNNYGNGYYNGMQMMQGYDPAVYQQQQYYQQQQGYNMQNGGGANK